MRAKTTLSTTTLLMLGVAVAGQNSATITGVVKDSTRQILAYAAVSLMNAGDSSMVKGALCDEAGLFTIEHLKAGDYFLNTFLVGYSNYSSGKFHIENDEKKDLGVFFLIKKSKDLKAAEIVVQKPFVEHFADKTVVNVENSIVSSGNSVYEVLERAPGVNIDQDGNISLRGKQGVNVMIDGKPVQMSADQLANYLRGMSASTVQKIELITNPSSKYDASGSAGIIDIKTKKGRMDGFNATVYSTYSQGKYEKFSEGFSFNLKHKRLNWFGNYDYGYRKGFYDLNLDRTFYSNGVPVTRYIQNNYVIFPFNSHTAKLGCDFYESPKTTIGFVTNVNSTTYNSIGSSTSKALDGSNELQYYYNTVSSSDNVRQNIAGNLNFLHSIDTLGKEIRADLDYAYYNDPIKQNFTNTYLDVNLDPYQPTSYVRSNVQANLQIFSGKIDYTHPFNSSLRLETGVKSSYVTADNDKHFYNTINGVEVIDTGKTNHFLYNENINAAYVSLNKDFKKIDIQIGLRGEQTIIHGNQVTNNIVFDRNYAQLFPTAFLLYKLNDNHTISFNYNKRIDRPNYESLNPFIIYVDPTFYKAGNPYLQPELSNTCELGYSYKQNISASVYFTRTNHNIGAVLLQDDINKITIQTEQNMDHVDYYGLNINASLKPFKWWNSFNNISIYNGTYIGEQQGQNFNRSNTVYSINSTNSFILPKDFSAELSFFYKTSEVYGLLSMNPMWYLNIGLKRAFMKNKLIVKAAYNDIFYSNVTSGSIQFSTINESFSRRNDTRIFTVSVSYIIGKGGASKSAKRQTGAEEEKKRAASTGS